MELAHILGHWSRDLTKRRKSACCVVTAPPFSLWVEPGPGQMAVSLSIIGGLKGLLSARVDTTAAIHREWSNAMIAGLCRASQLTEWNIMLFFTDYSANSTQLNMDQWIRV